MTTSGTKPPPVNIGGMELDDNVTFYDCRTGQRAENLTYSQAFEIVEQREAARVWRCNRCGYEVTGRIEYIFCACGGELLEKEGRKMS